MSKFEETGRIIGRLVDEKNSAYGDSFGRSGEILRVLFPDGVQPEQYDDFLAVTRVIDKLFRIATDRDALGESPWQDIAGYGLLGWARVMASVPGPGMPPRASGLGVPGPGQSTTGVPAQPDPLKPLQRE